MSKTNQVPNDQDPITLKDIEEVLDSIRPAGKKPITVSFVENKLMEQGIAMVMLSVEDFADLKKIYDEKSKS